MKDFMVIFCFEEVNDNVEQFSIIVQAIDEKTALAVADDLVKRCLPKRAKEI